MGWWEGTFQDVFGASVTFIQPYCVLRYLVSHTSSDCTSVPESPNTSWVVFNDTSEKVIPLTPPCLANCCHKIEMVETPLRMAHRVNSFVKGHNFAHALKWFSHPISWSLHVFYRGDPCWRAWCESPTQHLLNIRPQFIRWLRLGSQFHWSLIVCTKCLTICPSA